MHPLLKDIMKQNVKYFCNISFNYISVTLFISLHPAGKDPIIKNAGTDQTDSYDFHGIVAKALWKHYKIGKLEHTDKVDGCCCIIS